jgi:hypothetical protein
VDADFVADADGACCGDGRPGAEVSAVVAGEGAEDVAVFVEVRRLTRDLYVAPADLGFWQGTLREPSERLFRQAGETIKSR